MNTPWVPEDPEHAPSSWGGQQITCWINTYESYHLYRQRIITLFGYESAINNYVLLLLCDDMFDYMLFCLATLSEGPTHPIYYQREYPTNLFPDEFRYEQMEHVYESIVDMDLDRHYAQGIQTQIDNIALYTIYTLNELLNQIEMVIPNNDQAISSFFSIEATRVNSLYDVKIIIHYPNSADERVLHPTYQRNNLCINN